jgi:hypothetical protein
VTFVAFELYGQSFGLTPDEAFLVIYELRSPRAIYSPPHHELADRIDVGLREGSTLSTSKDERRLLIDAMQGIDAGKRTDAINALEEQIRRSLATGNVT